MLVGSCFGATSAGQGVAHGPSKIMTFPNCSNLHQAALSKISNHLHPSLILLVPQSRPLLKTPRFTHHGVKSSIIAVPDSAPATAPKASRIPVPASSPALCNSFAHRHRHGHPRSALDSSPTQKERLPQTRSRSAGKRIRRGAHERGRTARTQSHPLPAVIHLRALRTSQSP